MSTRRRLPFIIPLTALVLGAGAAAAPLPADGRWTAVADGLGGELTLLLKHQDGKVSGQALLARGTMAPATLAVSGSYQPPVLQLRLRSADGTVQTLHATVLGPEKMQATLTWHTGAVQPLDFVRP